jgi:hypothetical protein
MPITKASGNSVTAAAKGDLVVGNATNDSGVLSVGANDTVLTADSSTATGVKWAAASSGGMTLISNTVASALSSLSLSSIPSTYKNLMLTWSGINHSAANTEFNIRLNNDSGTNYDVSQVTRDGTGNYERFQTLNSISDDNYTPFGYDVNLTNSIYLVKGFILIENYASTSLYKNITGSWAFKPNQFSLRTTYFLNTTYKSTSAINSIDIIRTTGTATFSNAANTSIRLYGIS